MEYRDFLKYIAIITVAIVLAVVGVVWYVLDATRESEQVVEEALIERLIPPFGYLGELDEPDNPDNLYIQYRPERLYVCAGSELRWQITIDVRRVPAVADVSGRFNVYAPDTVNDRWNLHGGNTEFTVDMDERTLSEVTTYRDLPRSVTIPAELPPDEYRFTVTAETKTTRPAGYKVPVVVVACHD